MSGKNIRREVDDFIINLGAFAVGVADPYRGFANALKGCHPNDVMAGCRSVIVYAFNIGLDYYRALDCGRGNLRLGHLYRDWVGFQLTAFLKQRGYEVAEVPKELADEKKKIARMSLKLAAYEAGIGVFGRPSIIVTPDYGPRANLGVVLTDALMMSDGRMEGFDPCKDCSVCIGACPVNAIKADMPPPTGFDRQKCIGFVDWLREKTNDKVKLCGCCFNKCKAGKLVKKSLKTVRWTTFDDLDLSDRKRLLNQFKTDQ
jgi:epoxyqueuosine reductase QueG